MHLEVLVEERSAEPVVRRIAQSTLPSEATYDVRIFDGKTDLIGSLVERLRGYRNWQIDGLRVMVLVDRDADDCFALKQVLEDCANEAGLVTKSGSRGGTFQVCNRIAVEELEAWFLGDEAALRAVFPRVKPFATKAAFRDPDAVVGGTWEQLQRLLQRSGYYQGGLRKVDFATQIAPRLDITNNRSASFQQFTSGLAGLTTQ
jgi:hypothetical protein